MGYIPQQLILVKLASKKTRRVHDVP